MNKLAKKIAVYATIGTLGLTGCGANTTTNNDKNNIENSNKNTVENNSQEPKKNNEKVVDAIIDNAKEGDVKVFEPYEHLFYVRYEIYSDYGNSISIPDGYEVFEINNRTDEMENDSYTENYIWFTNKEKVKVEAVYNKNLVKWDYSNFGTVIENDKSSEKFTEKVK